MSGYSSSRRGRDRRGEPGTALQGRDLAERLGSRVCALLCGHDIAPLAEKVIHYGADVVLLADHPELSEYRTLPYARLATDLLRERQPYIFLLGATPVGRDLAPRIASAVRAGLTADCTALQIGDFESRGQTYTDLLYQIRPAFGGNVIATIVNPQMHPQMATVREGVMHLDEPDPTRHGQIERIEPHFQKRSGSAGTAPRDTPARMRDLKNADIIVSGGVGVGSKENFQLIYRPGRGARCPGGRLARGGGCRVHLPGSSGGADGGHRAAPAVHRRGHLRFGATPRRHGPISKIIAINTDPNAPIFQIAHYRIVGDLNEVLPRMIRAYRDNAK